MTEVRPDRPDESIESLIKRFNRKVIAAGIIKECRARQEYVKPSDKKRKERLLAKSKIRKYQAKMEKIIQFENENKFRKNKKRQDTRQDQAPQSTSSTPREKIIIAPRQPDPAPESMSADQE
jgi:ribosomal protein S21